MLSSLFSYYFRPVQALLNTTVYVCNAEALTRANEDSHFADILLQRNFQALEI